MAEYIDGVLKASPWFLYFGSIMYTAVSGDPVGIYFVVGMVLFGNLFNQLLKHATEACFGQYALFVRPNPPADGCGSFSRPESEQRKRKQTYGMPSGHAQQMAFAMGFWIYYFVQRKGTMAEWQQWMGIAFFVILWAAVSYHRVHLGCHNLAQVAVGSLVGVVSGALFYHVLARMVPKLQRA